MWPKIDLLGSIQRIAALSNEMLHVREKADEVRDEVREIRGIVNNHENRITKLETSREAEERHLNGLLRELQAQSERIDLRLKHLPPGSN